MRAISRHIPGLRPLPAGDHSLTALERLLSLCTPVQRGEGRGVALLLTNAFVLMLAYYLLKPVRETLVLTQGGAELKSYAMALQAVVLLVLTPLYSRWAAKRDRLQLVRGVNLFFAANLGVLFVLGQAGVPLGLLFFVWLGIFSVTVVAQFWAFAADLYHVESGQRLFAAIMVGASVGAWAGSRISGMLSSVLGPWALMLLAGGILVATLSLCNGAGRAVPTHARRTTGVAPDRQAGWSGFRVVLSDRYLRLVALLVVLLNCINSTGEVVLADWVTRHADELVRTGEAQSSAAVIGAFYGEFYSWICVLNVALQVLLVSRVVRAMGVGGAMLVLPVVAAAGYGLIAFVPIFSLIAAFKVLENSLDYSLQNTLRHTLFLPTTRSARFQGKTTIETFFYRFGDLLQAGVIYMGMHVMGFETMHFAILNACLAIVWIVVAVVIGRHYHRLSHQETSS
jgi:AAA family ATP:ADP antiporter